MPLSDGFTTMYASVRFEVVGFHHWPQPRPGREYLGQNHRHLFKFEVSITVEHHEREIEYHDLLDFCREAVANIGHVDPDQTIQFGGMSCESILLALGEKINDRWGDRSLTLKLYEDGEVGACLLWSP